MAVKKSLVIVESPAKANTINKYLGADYVVKASLGHVKDLPKSKLGVDIENNFEPVYDIIPGKEKVVKELRTAAKSAQRIFLAADPDREGEAICQHLKEILDSNKGEVFRVLFNEITPKAIRAAGTVVAAPMVTSAAPISRRRFAGRFSAAIRPMPTPSAARVLTMNPNVGRLSTNSFIRPPGILSARCLDRLRRRTAWRWRRRGSF